MHEASVMNALMRRIEAVARAEKAKRVTGVAVRLGALSHMSPVHFREHFDVSSAGTLSAGAALEIEVSENAADPDAEEIRLISVEVE